MPLDPDAIVAGDGDVADAVTNRPRASVHAGIENFDSIRPVRWDDPPDPGERAGGEVEGYRLGDAEIPTAFDRHLDVEALGRVVLRRCGSATGEEQNRQGRQAPGDPTDRAPIVTWPVTPEHYSCLMILRFDKRPARRRLPLFDRLRTVQGFGRFRQLTPRDIEHRRQMLRHLKTQAGQ